MWIDCLAGGVSARPFLPDAAGDGPIPVADAGDILRSLCEGYTIDKVRYLVEHGGHTWEVDVFAGDNAGLVIAEVELASEDEAVSLPDWVGAEVTGDPRYYNASLVNNPYCTWQE